MLFTLYFKTFFRNLIVVGELEKHFNLARLKEAVYQESSTHPNQQTLVLNDRKLGNDRRTLREYGLEDQMLIRLFYDACHHQDQSYRPLKNLYKYK